MATQLSRSFGEQGNQRKFTISVWVKRTKIGAVQTIMGSGGSGAYATHMYFMSSDELEIWNWFNSAYNGRYRTSAKYRDVNAWYHIVIAVDTTQATDTDRFKLYVNGELITAYAVRNNASQNQTFEIGHNGTHYIGGYGTGADYEGLMSHFHYCDGYQYQASDFGETDSTTGEWKIKADPNVQYGTTGHFILKDSNSVTDQSGLGHNWTVANGTLTNTPDCPSNVFATWNPAQATTSASYDFVSGNTRLQVNDVDMSCGATLGAKTGKFYMEMKWVQQGGNDRWGIQPVNSNVNTHPRTNGVGWDQSSNQFYMLGSTVSGTWGGSIGTSDIIQLAMDLDNGALYLGVNGTWRNSGSPTSGSSKTGAVDFSGTSLFGKFLTFAVGKGNNGTSGWNANFGNGYFETTAISSAGTNASGNGTFEYDVPTGYTALSTKGLNN